MRETSHSGISLHPGRRLFAKSWQVLDGLNQSDEVLAIAWELAHIPKEMTDAETMDAFILALTILVNQGQGHTRLALDQTGGPLEKLLHANGLSPTNLRPVIERLQGSGLVGGPGSRRPIIMDSTGAWLYSHKADIQEARLVDLVFDLVHGLARRPILGTQEIPNRILIDPKILNLDQVHAVVLALAKPLALITGGPGTGKTTTVVAIIRALLHEGMNLEDIALAAPTAKAAQRMAGAIQNVLAETVEHLASDAPLFEHPPKPTTLHRLLSWLHSEDRYRHGKDDPIPARVVIVDEASMISLEQMERLLCALNPDARLILLGDADQLPSVDAGRAFRDMVEVLGSACQVSGCRCVDCLRSSCKRLIINNRMNMGQEAGRNILGVAQKVNSDLRQNLWESEVPAIQVEPAGEAQDENPELITQRTDPKNLEETKVELLDPDELAMEVFLDRWFETRVLGLPGFTHKVQRVFNCQEGTWDSGDEALLKELLDHFDRFRILGATREGKGLRGVRPVNDQMHTKMRKTTGAGLKHATSFFLGEPILMMRNDYRRDIFNGEQGLVLKVRFEEEPQQAAVFPGPDGPRAFPLEALLPHLELCYAMTVHKSQGSEFERIAFLLPADDHKALTRELLYTGITRAKHSVILLGKPERVEFARTNHTQRETGLGERLRDRSRQVPQPPEG